MAAIVGTGATDLPPVAGLADPGPIVQFGIPISRTLLDICAVAAAGVAILARLLGFDEPAKTEPVMRGARRVGLWASVGWTVAALLSIVLLTAELHPGSFPGPGAIWAYVSNIAAGKGLLLSAACGLASAFLAWLSLRHGENVPAELRAGIALFGLLPLPLTGHASNWAYHDLSMVVMELHVVTASAWAGTLGAVVVFLARRPELLAVALPRYSRLATWCVLIVGATGVFTGLLELALSPVTSLPESLWDTRFGVLVLVKAGLFAVIAAIAVLVRSRLLPMIAAGRRTAICGLVRLGADRAGPGIRRRGRADESVRHPVLSWPSPLANYPAWANQRSVRQLTSFCGARPPVANNLLLRSAIQTTRGIG